MIFLILIWRSKGRKKKKKKQVVNYYVEVLYSDLEDLKQSKSERKEGGGGGGGGGEEGGKKGESPTSFMKSLLGAAPPPHPHPRFPLPPQKKIKKIQNLIFGPQCQAESRNVIKSLILVGPLQCWLLRLNTCFAT